MGKGNGFAQQALSTGLAAVTALTATATPGFAGNSSAIQSTLDCFTNYGWRVSGRTLQYAFKIFDDSTTQGRNTLTACALQVSRESEENRVAIMPLLKYANSGGKSKTQGITPETAKFYSASASYGSPAPSQGEKCRPGNTGNAEADQRIYNACVRIQVANAERDALNAESSALAAQKKYECILNQDQVNALIAQENKRRGRDNFLLGLLKVGTAVGSGIAFGENNQTLGWTLAGTAVGTAVFFPQRQMIQTGNYEQCAIIKENLGRTFGQ
jgi:hypothetical protein